MIKASQFYKPVSRN